MEGVALLAIIIGFIITNGNIKSKFKNLEETINSLNEKIKSLQEKIIQQTNVSKTTKETVFEEETSTTTIKEPEVIEEPPIIISEEKTTATVTPIVEEIPLEISLDKNEEIKIEEKQKETVHEPEPIQEEKIYEPKKPWLERFKEKNPDLEKFIGENLINKIGILILVLGISFFVKYAIDKDWINEPARVGIGVLCGALVMAIAHKLKKNYASFSSVLVAGAISIFYFTIYIAFHEYQLFSQTVAFTIMVVITAFSALVSVSYNRQELAVLSLVGGFAVPFMLSTGNGNYLVLFSYIAILNIGILAISYFKKWKIATIVSFVFTLLLYSGWCLKEIGNTDFPHKGALVFATLFYFIFSVTIVLSNLKNKGVFTTIEYVILIANTFFFFGMGMMILKDSASNFTGLFTLLLGIYNIIYASILFRKFGLDKNAVYLLVGLALTFATLTIPIQFNGNQITIFWALEAVLLFWLSQKSKINSFKIGAVIVQVLATISLLMDWQLYSFSNYYTVILNPLFITGFVVSVSLFASYWFVRKEEDFTTKYFKAPVNVYKKILIVVAIIITYAIGALEINYQAFQFLSNKTSALSFPVIYHFLFVSVLLYVSSLLKKEKIHKAALVISAISVFTYILFFYRLPTEEMHENIIMNGSSINYAFYFHYILLACLIYFGYQLFKYIPLLFKINPKQNKWLPWVFAFAIVYVLSNEIMIHGLHFSNNIDTAELAEKFPNTEENTNFYEKDDFIRLKTNQVKTQIIKIGYPILWGVFSFIFLIIGIKKQWKTLRVIALTLLGITIVKLFAYDIKNVSETGKIIAFILLGILILIISFVYQKIKKLVVDEDETELNTENNEEI